VRGSNNPHLLVWRFSALGDAAMAVHVLLALQREYPGIRLTVATKKGYTPVFEQIPGVRVFPVDTRGAHRGLGGLWKLYRELLALKPDAIADLHAVLRTHILRFFFRISGVRVAVLDKGRKEKRRLVAARGRKLAPLTPTHQRYAAVFAALGYPVELRPADVLGKPPWPEAIGIPKPGDDGGIRSRDGAGANIGVAPFAAHAGKCYPEKEMKRLLALLQEEKGLRVYLLGGGPEETRKLKQWEREFQNCTCVAGKGSLGQELQLIGNLDLVVSMDSGNGHLAALFGIPVITLWGVTHPYAGFAPFGQPRQNSLLSDRGQFPLIPTSVYGNKVPPGYEEVMASIPPETVYGCIRGALGPDTANQASTTGESERK